MKLKYLRRDTCGIMNVILRPSDCLTEVVGSGGKAVITTGKIGKSSHLATFPDEPKIDETNGVWPTIKSGATPALPKRLWIGCLGNAHNDSLRIFHVPCDTAVWSTEGAKIEHCMLLPISPQRSVPRLIAGQSGIACHPGSVFDTIASATCSAQRIEVGYAILCSMLCRGLVL